MCSPAVLLKKRIPNSFCEQNFDVWNRHAYSIKNGSLKDYEVFHIKVKERIFDNWIMWSNMSFVTTDFT